MAKIAIIPPNLPFFFDFSCQTQDYTQVWKRFQVNGVKK
jgi:hypothetical protein